MRGGRPRAGGEWRTRNGSLPRRPRRIPRPVLPDVAELQLLFAELNNLHFNGEIPAHRIAYNARFGNLAGRITYKPPLIELSPKHFKDNPAALRETLLHEMIHAWLYARGENPGHTPAFKRKMKELGLSSIYHDLGTAPPLNGSEKRYIVRCEKCRLEVLRKRKPPVHARCARCRRTIVVFEVVEVREVSIERRAARRDQRQPTLVPTSGD
jgi:predicted SprT family Zn-dependent metalloprotease